MSAGTFEARLRRLAAVGLAVFAACAIVLVADGLNDRPGRADVALVLGSKVNPGGAPSLSLAARLHEALSLYRQGRFATVIVSGGTGREGFDEAEVMKAWLVARGVPAVAVIADSHGDNTMATARNTAVLMRARGWRSVLVITQYFHVPRSRLALEKQGVATVYTAHARHFELRDVYSIPREVVGYAAYLLR